jgi:hypothetical protein
MVTQVRIDLFEAEIAATLQDDVGKFVVDTTVRTLNRAKVLCPVDTGNLRASHQMRIARTADRISGEVFTHVKYALPVHNGRGVVRIVPKTRQALAFTWRGQYMVRRSVVQPARKGRPWLLDALKEVAAQQGMQMGRGGGL